MAASGGGSILFPETVPAKLLKWKIKKGYRISRGYLLALYTHENTTNVQRLKSQEIGIVEELLVSEGDSINFGDPLIKIKGCDHPVVMKDMCAECGADLREKYGRAGDRKEIATASVAMVHSIPELTVSEAEALEIGHADEERLLTSRKLVLLVDLDQTLLHTTNDNIPANLKDVVHFQLWHGSNQLWYHTRFRPGTKKFLEKIATMYELHICTFGVRMYAHQIAHELDPEGKLFSHRILSRDECFNQQSKTANLKALFPCGDVMVCIIDDREDVWNHAPNLVHVKPYRFFQGTADINAPPGLDKTDDVSAEIHADSVLHHDTNVEKNGAVSSVQNNVDSVDVDKSKDVAGENSDEPKEASSDAEKQAAGDISGDVEMEVDSEEKQVMVVSLEKQVVDDSVEKQAGGDKDVSGMADAVTSSDNLSKISIDGGDSGITSSDDGVTSTGGEASGDGVTSTGGEPSGDKGAQEGDRDKDVSSSEVEMTSGDEVRTFVESEKLETGSDEMVPSHQGVKGEVVSSDQGSSLGASEDKMSPADCDESSVDSDNPPTEVMLKGADLNYQKKADGKLVEWADEDDYLFYLEDILTNIHKAYYKMHDESKDKGKKEVPDLKNIIPYVKRKVLRGVNIVFSCVFPRNIPAEKSKEYQIAKSLGAEIHENIIPLTNENALSATTHLIAAKVGTAKVNQALRNKSIQVVTPDWLWCCYHRWERVTEDLFKLTDEITSTSRDSPAPGQFRSKEKRKRPEELDSDSILKRQKLDYEADDSSMEADEEDVGEETGASGAAKISTANREFRASLSMYALSKQELEEMDREVDDIISGNDGGESSEDSESEDSDADQRLRKRVLSGDDGNSSSGESLEGEFPRGWKHRHDASGQRVTPDDNEDSQDVPVEGANEDRRHQIKIGISESDSSSSDGQYCESIGSVDEEMAEAVEKEFLSYNFL